MTRREKRHKILFVPFNDIFDMIIEKLNIAGIDDADVKHASIAYNRDGVEFLVYHESFPVVPDGNITPEIIPFAKFRTIKEEDTDILSDMLGIRK